MVCSVCGAEISKDYFNYQFNKSDGKQVICPNCLTVVAYQISIFDKSLFNNLDVNSCEVISGGY